MTARAVRKLTPQARQEIIDWYRTRRALGNYKTVAAKYGICVQYVEKILREHLRSKVLPHSSPLHPQAPEGYDPK